MDMIRIIIGIIGLSGFMYGFYCQEKAIKHISKEKIAELKDTSILCRRMPSKKVLSDEGLKYYKGFCVGAGIFVTSIILIVIISQFIKD